MKKNFDYFYFPIDKQPKLCIIPLSKYRIAYSIPLDDTLTERFLDMFIYQAELYCDKCGIDIMKELDAKGKCPADPNDHYSYDSDSYPKYGERGESDSPRHCGNGENCQDAFMIGDMKIGAFLHQELTDEGRKYVASTEGDVAEFWQDYYDIEPDANP